MKLALTLLAVCMTMMMFAQEPLSSRERMLLEKVEELERRLATLEARVGVLPADGTGHEPMAVAATRTVGSETAGGEAAVTHQALGQPISREQPQQAAMPVPEGTTINVNLDGYYAYNTNRPVGGMNALRGFDVSSNGFAINQAGLVIERLPDLAAGRRLGGRIDLMVGQATETLQGSPANELRPEVFRPLFQAYGTAVLPAGNGVTVDFGKWASSFGIEGNYTKDQLNYSRSYWFNFLPFYHMGVRVSYPLNGQVTASYWLTNGLNQTEDFNGFKSQAVLLNFQPSDRISANLNYFNGQEERSVEGRTPRGRSHFLDSYITLHANDRLTFAVEADYALERIEPLSAPRLVYGGAGYARYKFTRGFSLASRFAYLNDRDGVFSGTSQALKDFTTTATFNVANGFQMRWEYRRDSSSRPFFMTDEPGRLTPSQNTALVGLIWWFGGKQGAW